MGRVLPRIRDAARRYHKFRQVRARPAVPGEVVVSVTADGEETTNRADTDDMDVTNLTGADEAQCSENHFHDVAKSERE